MFDIHNILKTGKVDARGYTKECIDALEKMGMDIKCSGDFLKWERGKLEEFSEHLKSKITYYVGEEQALKLLGNSMYGGCSHASFYWYNMGLANDITGEPRNLIHMMEHHIPDFWKNNWLQMTDLHKKLGWKVDPERAKRVLETVPYVTKEQDPDAYNERSWVYAAYGDTDSCIGETKIQTEQGTVTIADLFGKNYKGADEVIITPNGSELVPLKQKILNYDENNNLTFQPANYIMRHKVTKPKWKLLTKTGKEIIVTEDHSLIVFRNGEKLEVKPKDVLKTDKILIIK